MTENELRISNLVTIDNPKYHPDLKDIVLQVTAITPNDKEYSISLKHINQKPNTYYQSYSQFIKYIKPILLTEEWLLKAGFFKNGYLSNRPDWLDVLNNYCIVVEHGRIYKGIGNNPTILYVHQLQNLYFALTGKELQFS